jgi:hypothetical protein
MKDVHMSKRPPIPPANRSNKELEQHIARPENVERAEGNPTERRPRNLSQQGQQGSIKQNTRHPGYQQDR